MTRRLRTVGVRIATSALVVALAFAAAPGGIDRAAAADPLTPALRLAASRAPADVVRRAGGFTVELLRAEGPFEDRPALYRVTVRGDFPPRSLRYVVSAGGRRERPGTGPDT